jgi:glycerophosphoryl diester phosphodiesterase
MTLAIAHRGDPRGAVENTLAAVSRAVALGADAVEVDLRLTADGVVVLHHDPQLDRVWGRPGAVAELPFAELRALVPEIPTLAEALALAAAAGIPLVLDVAAPEVALAALAELPPGVPAMFCGDAGALAQVRAKDEAIPLVLSWYGETPPDAELLAAVRPQYFNPEHGFLDEAAVRHWHDRGLKVCTWTVDDPARREQLLGWGVDAIISNDVTGVVSDCAHR